MTVAGTRRSVPDQTGWQDPTEMSDDQVAKDYLERRRAFKAAKERRDVPAIIGLLDAPDWGARVDASRALAQLGASEAAPRLRELAATDEEPIARSWYCDALARLGDPAAAELTLPLLQEPAVTVRSSAARTLGELGDPAALEAVRSARPTFRRSPVDWWVFRTTFRDSIASLERSAAGKKPRSRKLQRVVREAPWLVALGAIAAVFWIYVSFWWAAAFVLSLAALWLLMVYLFVRKIPLD
jgi:hypothetical protein